VDLGQQGQLKTINRHVRLIDEAFKERDATRTDKKLQHSRWTGPSRISVQFHCSQQQDIPDGGYVVRGHSQSWSSEVRTCSGSSLCPREHRVACVRVGDIIIFVTFLKYALVYGFVLSAKINHSFISISSTRSHQQHTHPPARSEQMVPFTGDA
jgi:hypothetical protein